jgi:thiamine-monophosphate kinase
VNLRDLGEGGLIRKIRDRFKTAAAIPIGDDAAVFDVQPNHSLVFCSDLMVENSDFLRDLHPPDSVGYKAIAANVSDVGAMGGMPLYFLISLAAPADLDVEWVDGFLDGVANACNHFEIGLLGGDSSSSDTIFVDVSMIGTVPSGRAIGRFGAKRGDLIYVSGRLGGSTLGLEHLKSGMKDDAVRRHLYPEPRHMIGAALRDKVHSMIDISDGLSTDLTHILEESRVSARIYRDRIPAWPGAEARHVLHGGEEYELILVGPPLPSTAAGVPLTEIGEIVDSGEEGQICLVDGIRESVLPPRGWQHW